MPGTQLPKSATNFTFDKTTTVSKSTLISSPIESFSDATDISEARTTSKAPYYQREWIICEVLLLICLFLALYIFYALVHFYVVQSRKRSKFGRSSGSRWLEKMCILSVILSIIRFANNQALLFMGWQSEDRCSILLNVSIAMYFISLHPVYIFLWIRQRIFYSNRSLKHLYSKIVRFMSWATLFCFFAITGVSMVLFVVDRENSATGRVCHDQHSDEGENAGQAYQRPVEIATHRNESFRLAEYLRSNQTDHPFHSFKVNTTAGLTAGCIQVFFLGLFLYPIMENKLRAVRNPNMRCHHSLISLIRRAFFLSGICIFSDVIIAFVVKSIYIQYPDAIFAPLAMYDINLIVNIVCIIATFRRWRRMLFPYLYTCCSGKFISGLSAKYYLVRRSTIACDTSNGGNARKLSEFDKQKQGELKIKAEKLPVVDVLLLSDGESSQEGRNGKEEMREVNNKQRENENCSEMTPFHYFTDRGSGKFQRKNSKKITYARRNTASGACCAPSPATINRFTGKPYYASSRFSFRTKKANNVITTKLVVKSEAFVWMKSSEQK